MRAWRAVDRFEGRSALRSWLYRIATNVCLDMLRGPPAPGPADGARAVAPTGASRPGARRCPRTRWVSADRPTSGCSRRTATRPRWRGAGAIRLAFVAALQHLPARQRAVLILCEVLRWQAAEVAELLGDQVARSTARCSGPGPPWRARRPATSPRRSDAEPAATLLARYVDAFERYDIDRAGGAAARRRGAVDAAVRDVAAGAGRHRPAGMLGPGRRLPRLAAHRRRRPTAARRSGSTSPPGRRARAVGAAGAGDLRRPDRRPQLLPDTDELFPAFGLPPHLPE